MAHDKALATWRASQAVQMRMSGVDYDYIAKELGYADKSGAWRAVNRAVQKSLDTSVEEYRESALADLYMLQEAAWRHAMNGKPGAVVACLNVIDKRMRVLGAYTPKTKAKPASDPAAPLYLP